MSWCWVVIGDMCSVLIIILSDFRAAENFCLSFLTAEVEISGVVIHRTHTDN